MMRSIDVVCPKCGSRKCFIHSWSILPDLKSIGPPAYSLNIECGDCGFRGDMDAIMNITEEGKLPDDVTFNWYQRQALTTDLFRPEDGHDTIDLIEYRTLCLCGEAGELANKVKKIRRDRGEITDEMRYGIIHELGDIFWYAAILADVLGIDLSDVAKKNIKMLSDRMERGKITGSGDER